MGRLEYWADDTTPTAIDSPLENLALYKKLMTDGVLVIQNGNGATLLDTRYRPTDFAGVDDPASDPNAARHVMLDYAAAMLSAAADKTGDLDVDVVVTINNFLGINGEVEPAYFDFLGYAHQRSHHFGTDTAEVLVLTGTNPDTYVVSTLPVLDSVFHGAERTASDARGFAAAADDDLTVLEFVHNYAPPEALE